MKRKLEGYRKIEECEQGEGKTVLKLNVQMTGIGESVVVLVD